jgi:peptidoglycan hydrolase-like protein with peptidoglycan-binding domain
MSIPSSLPFAADRGAGISRRVFLLSSIIGLAVLTHTSLLAAGYQVTGNLSALSPPVIEALQRRLLEAGYDPGPVDGRWGPRTAGAYAAFCRASDLPVADRLTREHVRALWDVDFDPETTSGAEMAEFLHAIGVRF